MIPGRLHAESQEVILAGQYAACISIARDRDGNALEVVIKPRAECGKEGGSLSIILQDLGIALSKMLQGENVS